MPRVTIDAKDFVRGESLTDDFSDGGFSPASGGIDLEKANAGLLYPQRTASAFSSEPDDEIVASVDDPSTLGNDAYLIDEAGNYYTLDGSTLTKKLTDGAGSYAFGTTDIVNFQGGIFITTTSDIVLAQANFVSFDVDWWTDTQGKSALSTFYRHPMEVVEDTLYIADENKIHTWNGITAVQEAMALPEDFNITSLRIHIDGRHLMAFASSTANFSHAKNATGKLFIIDTVNLEFIREIDLDDQVEGSINIGGVTFLTFGTKLGYFNGDGITFLRDLDSSAIYSQRLKSLQGVLLVCNGTKITAYGDPGGGNVYWTIYDSLLDKNIKHVVPLVDDFAISYLDSGGKLREISGNPALGKEIYNKLNFPGKVWIRKIMIEHETLASGSAFDLNSRDRDGTETLLGAVTFATHGAISESRIQCNVYTDLFQPVIDWKVIPVKGIRKITVFYEDGE